MSDARALQPARWSGTRPRGLAGEGASVDGSVKKVVVFGVTGVVGLSAARYFHSVEAVPVIGVARRDPGIAGAQHVTLDLSDRTECDAVLRGATFRGTTHVVYSALQESSDLAAGWRDPELMSHNLQLFKNSIEPLLEAHGSGLVHVSLLQGAKAYGFHVGRSPLPAKERSARDDHENFYFLQEDVLRRLSEGAPWSWTVLRPQVVYGESTGSPMNLLPAIGVYAALERARGRPLCFPGGTPVVQEATDARLLARAIGWAGESRAAGNEIFNVTNGDVFSWSDIWPQIAAGFGMEVGEPRLLRLAEVMPRPRGSGPTSSTVTASMPLGTCPPSSAIPGAMPISSSARWEVGPRRRYSAQSRYAGPGSTIASTLRICSGTGLPSSKTSGNCPPYFSVRDDGLVLSKRAQPCRPRVMPA